ncbi:MAG: cation-translocating P-type ATPase [Woeseiaceae bacterium]|nr:cation-translocating P-type ATPase [Woeseiaceae bacterium]
MSSRPETVPEALEDRQDILVIEGMFCAACAASVEATLKKQPGVHDASVNFAADAAVLQWTGEAANDVVAAVQGLGYEAHFVGDHRDSKADKDDPARDMMLRLIIGVFFGMWAMLPMMALYLGIVGQAAAMPMAIAAGVFSLPVLLYSGLPFYRMGIATLRAGVAGIDALILLGVIGSVILSILNLVQGSSEVYFEVPIALIVLQLIARLLDLRVRRRARDAVLELLEMAPSSLTLIDDDGSEREVTLKEAKAGARVLIRPGSRLAIDGRIVDGRAEVDRSLFSGESIPVSVGKGDDVHAGERVLDAALTVEITASSGKRRIDSLAKQVRQSLAKKPAWQKVADLAARYFLWVAAAASVAAAVGVYLFTGNAESAAVRALAVFVIACPCALSLAAPMAGLTASASAARFGMIIRDLNAATAAANPERLFLDKTGTLTEGHPVIVAVHPEQGFDTNEVVRLAARAERFSEHPIARAIVAASGGELPAEDLRTSVEPGNGIRWRTADESIDVGKLSWLAGLDVAIPDVEESAATRVGVAHNGRLAGVIELDDPVREGMAEAIACLSDMGVDTCILSGDSEGPVSRVAGVLGVDHHAGLSPEDKVSTVEGAREDGLVVAFAGDGINDGPALAAADLGIAVDDATDAARTAAAVSFTGASVADIPKLIRLTRKTRRVIRQNLTWAIIYNAVAIPMAMLGFVHPAIAAAAMALSSISILLNATRARLPASA